MQVWYSVSQYKLLFPGTATLAALSSFKCNCELLSTCDQCSLHGPREMLHVLAGLLLASFTLGLFQIDCHECGIFHLLTHVTLTTEKNIHIRLYDDYSCFLQWNLKTHSFIFTSSLTPAWSKNWRQLQYWLYDAFFGSKENNSLVFSITVNSRCENKDNPYSFSNIKKKKLNCSKINFFFFFLFWSENLFHTCFWFEW